MADLEIRLGKTTGTIEGITLVEGVVLELFMTNKTLLEMVL